MKSLFPIIPALLCAAGIGCLIAADSTPVNAVCPVTGAASNPDKTIIYEKEVKFCCKECEGNFTMSEDANVKKVATFNPETKVCLMCDKNFRDDLKVSYKRTVALTNDDALSKFRSEPDKFIVDAVKKPRPINTVCPVDGGAVDSNLNATYNKEVWFCCKECHENFSKDKDANVSKVADFNADKKICLMCEKKFDKDHRDAFVRVIGFATEHCLSKFKASPDTFIVKAIKGPEAK